MAERRIGHDHDLVVCTNSQMSPRATASGLLDDYVL